MRTDKKNLLIVVNPISGGIDKEDIIATISTECNDRSFTYEVYETTGHDDEGKIKTAIRIFEPDTVVAVGGDGTCNLVGCILQGTGIPMGIIPVGSANGLSASLDIPLDIIEALNIVLTGKIRSIDLIEINNKYISIHLSDLGFNANLVKRFHVDKGRGMSSYIKQFLKELVNMKAHKHTFVLDGHTFTRRAYMVAFANASKYGTGAVINPEADMSDGYFEVCIIRPFPWYSMLRLIFHFFSGRLKKSPYVKIIRCRHARVRSKYNLNLQVDGEVIGKTRQIEAECLPGQLNIIVP